MAQSELVTIVKNFEVNPPELVQNIALEALKTAPNPVYLWRFDFHAKDIAADRELNKLEVVAYNNDSINREVAGTLSFIDKPYHTISVHQPEWLVPRSVHLDALRNTGLIDVLIEKGHQLWSFDIEFEPGDHIGAGDKSSWNTLGSRYEDQTELIEISLFEMPMRRANQLIRWYEKLQKKYGNLTEEQLLELEAKHPPLAGESKHHGRK